MSTLTVGTIQSNTTLPPVVENSAGTQIGTFCRAWVNFNGTGTVAIRAAFNVSSITDAGVGSYTCNFTTAMPDADYAVQITKGFLATATNSGEYYLQASSTTTSALIRTYENNALADVSSVSVAIFR